MSAIKRVWKQAYRSLALTGICALLVACSTTGRSFDSSGLARIIPGQTTLPEAAAILKAQPEAIYRARDGSALVRWAHKASLLTDAIYVRQELSLQFGADGRFQYVAQRVNVPDEPGRQPVSVRSTGPTATNNNAGSAPADSLSNDMPQAVPQDFPYNQPLPSSGLVSYPVH